MKNQIDNQAQIEVVNINVEFASGVKEQTVIINLDDPRTTTQKVDNVIMGVNLVWEF